MRVRHRPIQSEFLAYSTKGKLGAFNFPTTQQMEVYNARVLNRSGSALNAAILRRLNNYSWQILTKVSSAYANVTAAIVAGTSTPVVTTTNNDGFIVKAKYRFGFIGLTVSNTATGGTYTFEYWNGTTWATLTTLENFSNFNSTGDKFVAFLAPHDWAAGDDTATGDQSYFSIRILHTTAPADAGNISAMWIGQMLDFMESLADNAGLQLIGDTDSPLLLDGGENIMPYFSTAAAENAVACIYGSV